MRRSIIFAFVMLLTGATALPASAQVILEMSQITCQQYMASDPERRAMIAAWMSGYFSASKNLNLLDFQYVEYNKKVVGAYCKKHKKDTLMSAIMKKAR